MKLTDPILLSNSYTDQDVLEIASVAQSTLLSTPLARLRYQHIPETAAIRWLEQCFAHDLTEEFSHPPFSDLDADAGRDTQCTAHLVVRDLDLDRLNHVLGTSSTPGRIVSHANFVFHPSFNDPLPPPNPDGAADKSSPSFPPSGNLALHNHWNEAVVSALARTFGGLPCISVEGISTLTPSHLRKGIARQLIEWVFPFAEAVNLPVILAASPLGLPLYLKCGFERVAGEGGEVLCDLKSWGWVRSDDDGGEKADDQIHRHVLMVRWPINTQQLDPRWKAWRKERKY